MDAIPLWLTVGLLQMQSVPDSIIYGFLFQNPVQSPMPPISYSTAVSYTHLHKLLHFVVHFKHGNIPSAKSELQNEVIYGNYKMCIRDSPVSAQAAMAV